MTARELIASGLLEAYVLGEGSRHERLLVERMRASDAGVRAELDAIELALEEHAMSGAVEPPTRTRAAVLGSIGADAGGVVPLMPNSRNGKSGGMNWLAAASVGALLFSGVGNWMQWSELKNVRERLAGLEEERTILAGQVEAQRASINASQQELAVLLDPSMRMVQLTGMGTAPDARARIYWSADRREVHMAKATLPAPPEGMQYQLWAIVDGQPVDAGMMPMVDDGAGLHRMKDIGPAQAFAVTLEKAGGVPSPTLAAMVLIGQVG